MAEAIAGIDEACIANLNAPKQTVISGTEAGLEPRRGRIRRARHPHASPGRRLRLPFAVVADARGPLAAALAECGLHAPARPVYSNITAAPLPDDPAGIAALLADHLTSPVRFQEEVEAMYAAGARIFVEVGPQGVVTGLVSRILGNRPHVAVATNAGIREDLVQFQHVPAHLLTCGVNLRWTGSSRARRTTLPWAQVAQQSAAPQYGPSTWLVNSRRVRPLGGPEPATLGQPNPSGVTMAPAVSNRFVCHGLPGRARPHWRTPPHTAMPHARNTTIPHACLPNFQYRRRCRRRSPGATGVPPVPAASADESTRVISASRT